MSDGLQLNVALACRWCRQLGLVTLEQGLKVWLVAQATQVSHSIAVQHHVFCKY